MRPLKNTAVIALGLMVSALTVSDLFAADAVSVRVLKDTQDRVVVELQPGHFGERLVDIDGFEYTQISLGRESLMKARGAPALPNVCRSIVIPDNARMTVRVLEADYYDIPDILVAPSKGVITRAQNPAKIPYTFGRVYDVDTFYPAKLVAMRKPYILRDHRAAVLEFNPFRYNPVTETLRVYTKVVVEVVNVGLGRVNVLDRRLRAGRASRAFNKLYKDHFLNYKGFIGSVSRDETGDMLIICHDAWLPNIQPLVDHKNAIGINTTDVGVSTIGNDAESIKNYIQDAYDSGDLSFVLLVGDAAQVASPSSAGGSADPTYALVAGDDHYPDIFVGRFSAETAADVDTQVLRTIEYEQLPATDQDWFKQGIGIASAEGGPGQGDDDESDIEHMNNIRVDLLGYEYGPVDQVYDPGASASAVSAALNAGRGIINYVGHGSITAWSTTGFNTTSVNNLTNDNMLPFITSVACKNGKFDGYTCFAEAWLRATHVDEPTGAIAIYASSINQSWASPMCGQDEIVDLLVSEAYFSFGALCFAGSCQMMDEYGEDGRNMFDTWHVFGDPSVRVSGATATQTGLKVTPATGLVSSGPVGGPFTPDSVVYTLKNQDDTGLIYRVSKNQPWVSLDNTGRFLPPHGTATVTVSINADADALSNGNYSDTIDFVNITNGDGNTTRSVSLQVGCPKLVYNFPMDTSPGWTGSGQWAFGEPTGQGGFWHGNADPAGGATGANVCAVNLNGDYFTEEGGPYYLTTAPMNLTDYENATLKFQRWLNTDYVPFVSVKIEASNNGSDWSLIWNNGTDEIADSSWSEFDYDISTVADDQETVYVRWSYAITDENAYAYSGWNIDDVEIWAIRRSSSQLPGDWDGNGDVDLDDYAVFRNCLAGPNTRPPTSPSGCLDAFDFDDDADVDLADFAEFAVVFTDEQ